MRARRCNDIAELAKLGVTVLPIVEAARKNPALVERLLGQTVRYDESRFTGLNGALLLCFWSITAGAGSVIAAMLATRSLRPDVALLVPVSTVCTTPSSWPRGRAW